MTAVPRTLRDLRGVGPELERKLAGLDIRSPAALAYAFPRDYKDWRKPAAIADVVRRAFARTRDASAPDSAEEIVVARVVRTKEARARVPVVSAELDDGTGRLWATWFGRRGFAGKLAVGDRLFVYGRAQVRHVRGAAHVELNVMQHRQLDDDERFEGAVVPVYRASKDVPSRTIAALVERNLDALAALVRDDLPEDIVRRLQLAPARDAWRAVHRPPTPEAALDARERLVFEEFFFLALAAALRRAERERSGGAAALSAAPGLLDEFEAALPFRLTGAQRREIERIWADMDSTAPMNRLLQGDVGSGKTLVAAAAVLLAARAGVQSALMAPTEILAAQHAAKLAPLLVSFGLRTDALFGSMGSREREGVRARLESGACDLVVGTHALIEEGIVFRELGLAIIDEQHRFGVAQRARLRGKSRAPHTLHMTATPIPRTLAQTRYADLDVSVLDELPPGRTPIVTFVVRESRKALAYAFVRENVARGRQAYVVAPAIDESESALTSALAELDVLRRGAFADLAVELLHGRLSPREKDAAMARFVRGEAQVLMATTVVEVGVDVPNASVMVILDANRYGLAQLHQLRGRVGRGVARSYCILVAPDEHADAERLSVLAETTDGFAIADADLRLRGTGEFAGTAQAGQITLLGDLVADFGVYERAKREADALVASDPLLEQPEHVALRALAGENAFARATLLSS